MAEPDEAEQLRNRLLKTLARRQDDAKKLDRYYRGEHDLQTPTPKATEAFRRFMRKSRTNWCQLIVDAVAERCQIVGFRFGETPGGDDDAWKIWQANHLDADSELVHIEALVSRRAFTLVWPDDGNAAGVSISGEHPLECVVEYVPGERRERSAALKAWIDPVDGFGYATLYLPDEVWKYRSRGKTSTLRPGAGWEPRSVDSEDWPIDNPMGRVPIVEFVPQPRMMGEPMSELDTTVIDIQDRINETLLDRMMAAEFAAFRQRYATGLEIQYDEQGNAKEPFKAAIDRLWTAEDKDVKFGEFTQTELSGYISAVEADVLHLAAITRTPPHYLLGRVANVSGDALKAAETGLVAKSHRRMAHLGESWEETMALAFAALDDEERANDVQSEVIWKDPESRSEGELVDALVKMKSLGVPESVLWQRWGASPQEVNRWKAMQASSAFSAGALVDRALPAALPPALPAGEPA